MTNQSHTELAARCRSIAEHLDHEGTTMGTILRAAPIAADLLRHYAAALESPERVQEDAVRTQLEWFALAAHWYINASDRELAEQGQERVDALKQVHLLSGHLEASGFKFSTPPTAPAQDAQGGLKTCRHGHTYCLACMNNRAATPSPQAERVPLSDAELDQLWPTKYVVPRNANIKKFARAIEAHHGIVTKESST